MADVALQTITKRFGRVTALDAVSFEIKDGEFFVLLGPTGAGKTTALRIIAGLEKQESGRVLIDGVSADALAPADRDVAFVFQQYSLYPTMSVYDNLAFPLRSPLRKTPEPDIKRRVTDVAEKLRITHLIDRKTAHLSGGEMQRVSLGRALVRNPRIYLMDEPLSNLDAKLRESLRVELKHLQKVQHSTTLFVTHDQVEALTMADRIAVLREGRIAQMGTPHDIYDRPADTFVAQLVGTPRINLLPAASADGWIAVKDSTLRVSTDGARLPSALTLGVRPEDVLPRPEGEFEGRVTLVEPLGVETVLHIAVGGQTVTSMVPGMSALQRGEDVRFHIARDRLHFFALDGQRISFNKLVA